MQIAGLQQRGDIRAKIINPGLQPVVEHIAHHGHATLRPLPHATEVRVVELSLIAIASHQRHQQMFDCPEAHPMAGGNVAQTRLASSLSVGITASLAVGSDR